MAQNIEIEDRKIIKICCLLADTTEYVLWNTI